MLRCEGYKPDPVGLKYCNGIIWPWQTRTYHPARKKTYLPSHHIANGWTYYTHVGHKTVTEVMNELIKQPLLGEY